MTAEADPLEIPVFLRRTRPGAVAQLDSAPESDSGGCRFESGRSRQPLMSLKGIRFGRAPLPDGSERQACPSCKRALPARHRALRIWIAAQLEFAL